MLDALAAALEREFVRDGRPRAPQATDPAHRAGPVRTRHSTHRRAARHHPARGPTDLDQPSRLAEQPLRAQAPGSTGNGRALVHLGAARRVEVSLGEAELAQVVGNFLDDALLHGQPSVEVRFNRAGLIDRTDRGVARLEVEDFEVEDSGPEMEPRLLATATRGLTRH
jgi:two-component system, OmpR family, sensor kinase